MAPRTRSSQRIQQSPSPTATTASTNQSPLFSSTRASTVATRDTSVVSDVQDTTVKTGRATRSKTDKKRAATPSDEEEEESVVKPAPKRRAVSGKPYVEVKTAKKGANKGKEKALLPAAYNTKNKITKRPVPATSEDEAVSDSELEYQDFDESDSSGSEFVDSEDEEAVIEVDFDDDEADDSEDEVPLRVATRKSPTKKKTQTAYQSDDEDMILQAAIELSRRGEPETEGAGSSSGNTRSHINPEAVRRAEAAERRLAQGNSVVDDSAMDDLELRSLESGSEDEAPKVKGKGKGKVASQQKFMTVAEMRRARRRERQEATALRRATKKEERELVRKLGRKLTHAERTTLQLHKHHPELSNVWGDLEANIKIIAPVKAEQPKNIKLTLLPFQLEGLYWMKKQEQGVWRGGMLADEMGMGKTIQIISLLVSDNKKPTLVVAPTVAIMQWKNEIETHTDGMKVCVWHGSSRESNVKELSKHDVVLTTYAVVESSFRKQESGFKRSGKIIKEKSPLHLIHWHRIILDEAHNIKERSTNTAKAVFEMSAEYRWCLSGTPLQNRVGELYSLIRFLGGDPFSYYFCKKCDCKSLHWKFSDKRTCDDCGHSPMNHTCLWNNEILTPIQKHGMTGPGKIAFKKLKILLDRMMLRRTKIQRADDLGLPPRTVVVRKDYLSPEEKELYLSLFSDAKRQFNTYLDHGTVLNNYSNIFSLLTRMRQMACHPDLVLRSKTNTNKFLTDDNVGEATVCRICNDIAEDAIQSKCRHIFDRECIKQYLNTAIEQNPACPVCHVMLTIDLEAPALDLEANVPNARQGILGRLSLDKWRSSTKIEALVEELSNLRNQDATTKSLVFSQFVNFLDLIAYRLQKAGFTVGVALSRLSTFLVLLSSSPGVIADDASVVNNVDVTVFLVSLKAGGVALNLTEASRVYLMDPWWNPAVEFQAMDRIHRLGQRRPVKAIKLVVEDSIESRIVQLQEKKSAMIDATLSPDDSAMGRLTPEDLSFLFRL
ncbi:hypothetical protein D9758_010160 [Tetrapyrgos nigripes]|uniref:Uncharacterized protein n=1 Tax=Tetrapyrgos nigripes TaxID=182062 RepID=A0A8H5CS14_9AGAR|nr:hypothetical protein D9758_010160 [Tetrapyrgos nigripes]